MDVDLKPYLEWEKIIANEREAIVCGTDAYITLKHLGYNDEPMTREDAESYFMMNTLMMRVRK